MKYKNYKSAIHNFAHSFMSIDYGKSGRLAINVLIDSYNKGFEPKADFDFINLTINQARNYSLRASAGNKTQITN